MRLWFGSIHWTPDCTQSINKGGKKGTGLDDEEDKVDAASTGSSQQLEEEDGKEKGSKEKNHSSHKDKDKDKKDKHKEKEKKKEKNAKHQHKAEAAENDEFEDAHSWRAAARRCARCSRSSISEQRSKCTRSTFLSTRSPIPTTPMILVLSIYPYP